MSSSKFKSVDEYIRFSEKTKSDIDETGNDVLQKIKNMDQETSNHLLVIISNKTIKSMFNLICDLQEIIIKSNEEKLCNISLKTVVKKLSQDCNELVQEFENDLSVLKEKFEMFIKNILHEAAGLFNVIKMDYLHAHKHELVEVLKEILSDPIIDDIKKQYCDDISKIGTDPESLKYIVLHRKHMSIHAFDLACYLNKVASNYDGEIQHRILNAANLFSIAIAEWLVNTTNTEFECHLNNLNKGCEILWAPVEELLQYIENELETSTNLKDVVAHLISFGMVGHSQSGRSIKHDST